MSDHTTRATDGKRGLPDQLVDLPATIPALLAERAHHGDDVLVVGPGFRLTFGEADRRSRAQAAQLLAAGVGKGTRVGILFANGPEWVVAWLAATRIGALSVPLSTFSPGVELARTIRHTDVQALVMAQAFGGEPLGRRLEQGLSSLATSPPALALPEAPYLRWIHVVGDPPAWSSPLPEGLPEELVEAAEGEVHPSDAMAIINTSGATAAPKAVVHSQGSLVRHAALLARRRGLTREDRIYSPMPFFWVGGLTMVLLSALSSGAVAIVQERFEAGEALDLIEGERATQISCWPNASAQLAAHPTFARRDLSAVRGGTLVEALPLETRPPSADRAPMPLGMTETGGPHTGPDDAYQPLPVELAGTFGRSLPGMEHVVRDATTGREVPGETAGELLLRGHFVMSGFYKQERHQTFTADGWYPTGDLGWFGADGHLRFTGRGSSMIKTGGSNVSPGEVEAALLGIPNVREAYVVGIPHPSRGEEVAAVLVADDDSPVDMVGLATGLRAELATYKVPRHLRVLGQSEVPKLPTGKVDMTALRRLFE
jgi:acyl-CoA synthetase (AMP-forming)/AMP-acid ligase II